MFTKLLSLNITGDTVKMDHLITYLLRSCLPTLCDFLDGRGRGRGRSVVQWGIGKRRLRSAFLTVRVTFFR